MTFATRRQISLALKDLLDGTRIWRTWYVLGVSELRQRYRRSMLGPFWVTLSMGIQALVMGFLLAFLFKIDVQRYLPFLCISLVTWTFLMTSITEGANSFITMSAAILQVKRPLWTYMMLTLWRNAIIYAHTVVVFVAAAVVYGIYPSNNYLLVPVGLVLLAVNVGWMALAAGLLSARFRDVPLLIQNLFTVLVWVTPVYYQPEQLGPNTRMFTELNPLTHVMDVARAPFLNEVLPLSTWLIALSVGFFGWMLALGLFARTRARVPYWL
jgi:ABC-type polysaccharide/polyol phosphate export permease